MKIRIEYDIIYNWMHTTLHCSPNLIFYDLYIHFQIFYYEKISLFEEQYYTEYV